MDCVLGMAGNLESEVFCGVHVTGAEKTFDFCLNAFFANAWKLHSYAPDTEHVLQYTFHFPY